MENKPELNVEEVVEETTKPKTKKSTKKDEIVENTMREHLKRLRLYNHS